MIHVISLLCGAIFGAGLAISGMHDPSRILAFLNLNGLGDGTWDGTLGLVFASAVAVMLVAQFIRNQTLAPLAAPKYYTSTKSVIDAPLIWGSILFGFGWGLVGLCPGPVLAAFAASTAQGASDTAWHIALFFAATMVGMLVARPIIAESSTNGQDKTEPVA